MKKNGFIKEVYAITPASNEEELKKYGSFKIFVESPNGLQLE